jgi:hypothetical protein
VRLFGEVWVGQFLGFGSVWARIANVGSVVVAIGVLVAGVVFVVAPAWSNAELAAVTTTTTTTTTDPGKTTTVHTVVAENGKTTTTDTSTTEPKKTTTVDVTAPQAPSLFERYLTKGHLGVFVLFGIVALAAFLAGAVVQRILRAEYGITLGPLTIPAITAAADANAAAIATLRRIVTRQTHEAHQASIMAAEALEATARLNRQLAAIRRQLP